MGLCSSFVQDFFRHDLMLRQWRGSRHCFDLIRNTKRWGLLTSFSRATQLGADVSREWLSFNRIRKAAGQVNFASKQDANKGNVGIYLTSVLLIHFLEEFGVDGAAEMTA